MPATVEIKNGPYSPTFWTDMIHTQANGNAVIEMGTVGDVTVDFDKYVIQVFDATVSSIDPVNDIRIAPNRVGRAIKLQRTGTINNRQCRRIRRTLTAADLAAQ